MPAVVTLFTSNVFLVFWTILLQQSEAKVRVLACLLAQGTRLDRVRASWCRKDENKEAAAMPDSHPLQAYFLVRQDILFQEFFKMAKELALGSHPPPCPPRVLGTPHPQDRGVGAAA